MIYFVALLLIYFISIIDSKKINRVDIILFIFLAIISGFRYGVGTDYFSYEQYYNLIQKGYEVNVEPGFYYINNFFANIGLGSQAVFLFFSILTMVFLYKGIQYHLRDEYTYKPAMYIMLIIFVFFPSLNVVRQLLAAAILFYGSKYIIEKEFLKFTIWVIIATLFHFSSIIFLALYFLALKNYNRIILSIILVISLILTSLGAVTTTLEFILANLPFLDFGGYIETYLNSTYNEREVEYGLVFFMNFFLLICFLLFKNDLINSDKTLLGFNFFYLYILFYLLSMEMPALTRLTYFFGIYMVITIPKMIQLFGQEAKIIIKYAVLSLYSIIFFYTILNGFRNPLDTFFIPYESNFNLFPQVSVISEKLKIQ